MPFFRKRTIWWPTWLGFASIFAVVGAVTAVWWFEGEKFLSLTERQPADVLVVEGWISTPEINAAAAEFKEHGYHYVLATGTLKGESWETDRASYAEEAAERLLRAGVPPERIIRATTVRSESQRTYSMATAARDVLRGRGIHPLAINVFTRGPHARRSRLVYAKVFALDCPVGVIAWAPSSFQSEPWWRSSDRSQDMLKETVGYFFELILGSARRATSH